MFEPCWTRQTFPYHSILKMFSVFVLVIYSFWPTAQVPFFDLPHSFRTLLKFATFKWSLLNLTKLSPHSAVLLAKGYRIRNHPQIHRRTAFFVTHTHTDPTYMHRKEYCKALLIQCESVEEDFLTNNKTNEFLYVDNTRIEYVIALLLGIYNVWCT